MKKRRKTLLLIGVCFWGMATLHAQTAFDPMLDANARTDLEHTSWLHSKSGDEWQGTDTEESWEVLFKLNN